MSTYTRGSSKIITGTVVSIRSSQFITGFTVLPTSAGITIKYQGLWLDGSQPDAIPLSSGVPFTDTAASPQAPFDGIVIDASGGSAIMITKQS